MEKLRVIESIRLKNFQSHVDSLLNFHPGVNVIVGTSDSGKTAVLRAFGMVSENKPSGEGLISHWAKREGKIVAPIEVRLCVDGHEVIRRRDGRDNLYVLDDREFRAFGGSVPDDIAKLLNLSDVNVQGQHDSVFLLSSSAGEIARRLNRVVDLDKIDSSIKEINRNERKISSNLEQKTLEEKELAEQVKTLSWVFRAEEDVRELEVMEAHLDKVGSDEDIVRMLVSQVREIDVDRFSWITAAEVDVGELDLMLGSLEDSSREVNQLKSVIDAVEEIEIREVDEKLVEEIDTLISMSKQMREINEGLDELEEMIGEIVSAGRQAVLAEEQLVVLEEQFHREMPDTCPLCGRSG